MGMRFFHPARTWIPRILTLPKEGDPLFGVVHEPEVARRGVHFNTLEQNEAWVAFLPEAELADPDKGAQLFDWVVKNRGNHVQWTATEPFTTAYADSLIAAARARGLTTGLGLQLYQNQVTRQLREPYEL